MYWNCKEKLGIHHNLKYTYLVNNDFDNLAVFGAFFDNFRLQLFIYLTRSYHVLKHEQSMMSTVTLRQNFRESVAWQKSYRTEKLCDNHG